MVNRVADNLKLSTRLSTQVYNDKNIYNHSQSLSTTSIMNRQLLRQKVRQKISVIKTNTCVFVAFKTKRELKCKNELFL